MSPTHFFFPWFWQPSTYILGKWLSFLNLNFHGILVGSPWLNHHHFWQKKSLSGRLETSPQLHGFVPQVHERVVAVPTGLPWRAPGGRQGGKSREVPGGRNGIGSAFFSTRCYHLTCSLGGWLCTLPKHVASCMYWNSRWWCFSMNCIHRRDGTLYWPRT